MSELRVRAAGPLKGTMRVPGDKSMSHRAVILASIARGQTRVKGLLESDDVRATMNAFQAMGVEIEPEADGGVKVEGKGPEGLVSPKAPIDLGNSGTSMRLLAGLLSGLPVEAVLTGDPSLRKRPMKRVTEPLSMMGAGISGSREGTAPLTVKGRKLTGIRYSMPMASAQVKSAILLAGLRASGETWVEEPAPTRDHTERMLPAFGVAVKREGAWAGLAGGQEVTAAAEIEVPGDFSSAAFFIVAALIVPGSEVVIENVGINPTRTGLLDVLETMGARVELKNIRSLGEEPVADLVVGSAELVGTEVKGDVVPRAIDELPVLCVAAALARGRTVIRGAEELRVKESDRIAAVAGLLTDMGVRVEEFPDGLGIWGGADLRGAVIDPGLDHRIAMAAAVAGLRASGETVVRGARTISSSFPDFGSALTRLHS